ncbi:Rv1355c family protein [Dietzia alimentaria]|uniref:Rv1355c family protein n=1 Tax=Dietzia alimentaria TaxID=665550 RepID=UPI00029B0657|nr:Rv1355c family protein [Dietzia alimentaria]
MTDLAKVSYGVEHHRAEIIDQHDPAQADRLAFLLSTCATVVDHTASQIEALAALPESFDTDWDDTRWVYYPWRSQLIRLLAPAGFHRLRLDRNRHKITSDEQVRARALNIGVVGLSVGHAVAHTLALEGLCGRLRLADFDRMELSNLNRVPATVLDIGVNKAVVAARRIAELDPYLEIEVEPDGITEKNLDSFLDGLDLVAEECDSFDTKVLIRDRARAKGIPVLMETSDGGVLDVERFDLEPTRPLFHGRVGELDRDSLATLTTEQKVPLALEILDGSQITDRMAASALELGRSLTTWPQTGGDVALGGASVAAAVRRMVRGQSLSSGRIRVDLDKSLDELRAGTYASAAPTVDGADPRETAARPRDPREVAREDNAVEIVLYAVSRSPSYGNSQPWRLGLADETLEIREGSDADTPVDLAGRSTSVGLGAAWFSAATAAGAVGLRGTATFSGEFDDPRLTVDLTPAQRPRHARTDGRGGLESLLARHTCRIPGDGSPLTREEVAAALDRPIADAPGDEAPPRVLLLDDPAERSQLAALLGMTERLRFLTPHLHADWIARHPLHPESTGVPESELALAQGQVPMQTILRRPDVMACLRDWGAGSALGADVAARVGSASATAVVLATDQSARAHIRAGWVGTDLWVRATSAGLAVYPMTPIFLHAVSQTDFTALAPHHADELAELAEQFRQLTRPIDCEVPAMLLLLSHAPTTGPVSRRRPVEDLLD